MSTPRISAVMPLYNTKDFVAEAIDSILSQTFEDFELILVDNGSTDGTYEYAMSLSDSRIRVIREAVRGPGAATNAGIAVSRAELFAIMDSDDIAHHDRFQLQIEFMDAHPEVVLLGTRFAFQVGSEIIAAPPQPREHDQIRRALMHGCPVICNSTTMGRMAAVTAIKHPRGPGPGEDVDFFLRISDVGELHNLTALLHYYRLHDRSISAVQAMTAKKQQSWGVVCARARAKAVCEPTENEFNRQWSARSAFAKALARADCTALSLYRKAIIKRAQRQYLSSFARIAVAAMLNPWRTAWHFKRRLGLC